MKSALLFLFTLCTLAVPAALHAACQDEIPASTPDEELRDNGDGTVTYRPDFDFTGTDSFKYWVTDGQGNFTPATVTVQVGEDIAPTVIDAERTQFDTDSLNLPADQGLHIRATDRIRPDG